MPITRLGSGGYGVKRAGSFAGKTASPVSTIKTRLGSCGYGVRRAGSFSGKSSGGGGGMSEIWLVLARRRGKR